MSEAPNPNDIRYIAECFSVSNIIARCTHVFSLQSGHFVKPHFNSHYKIDYFIPPGVYLELCYDYWGLPNSYQVSVIRMGMDGDGYVERKIEARLTVEFNDPKSILKVLCNPLAKIIMESYRRRPALHRLTFPPLFRSTFSALIHNADAPSPEGLQLTAEEVNQVIEYVRQHNGETINAVEVEE